jgi:hypothetical protein
LVLWGDARPYGNGVIARAHLSVPKPTAATGLWNIEFAIDGRVHHFRIDLPARRYDFAPIVLNQALVNQFKSPSALTIYDQPKGGKVIGMTGDNFFQIERDNPETMKIRSGALVGWIHLPRDVFATRSGVSDFVAAVIRILRQDWTGADELFDRALKNSDTPAEVRVDIYLYKAFIADQLHQSPEQPLKDAAAINAFSNRFARFRLMTDLAELRTALKLDAPTADILAKLRADTREYAYTFAPDDRFLAAVRRLLSRAKLSSRVDAINPSP